MPPLVGALDLRKPSSCAPNGHRRSPSILPGWPVPGGDRRFRARRCPGFPVAVGHASGNPSTTARVADESNPWQSERPPASASCRARGADVHRHRRAASRCRLCSWRTVLPPCASLPAQTGDLEQIGYELSVLRGRDPPPPLQPRALVLDGANRQSRAVRPCGRPTRNLAAMAAKPRLSAAARAPADACAASRSVVLAIAIEPDAMRSSTEVAPHYGDRRTAS